MRTAQVDPLWRIVTTRMPTKWGLFDAIGFERVERRPNARIETALAIVMGDLTEGRSTTAHPFTVLYRRSARVAAL